MESSSLKQLNRGKQMKFLIIEHKTMLSCIHKGFRILKWIPRHFFMCLIAISWSVKFDMIVVCGMNWPLSVIACQCQLCSLYTFAIKYYKKQDNSHFYKILYLKYLSNWAQYKSDMSYSDSAYQEFHINNKPKKFTPHSL